MPNQKNTPAKKSITAFKRDIPFHENGFTAIGRGELGGKANGLAEIKTQLESISSEITQSEMKISIPPLTVITTSFFSKFMEMNNLYDIVNDDISDENLAHYFQQADLPADLIGDLRSLISQINTPLAVRSSSLLEDRLDSPFAGIYQTKMIPNNQTDTSSRFLKLIEAIKFIYASTFFQGARNYMKATGNRIESEEMAVIIQEVVGKKHYHRFYPNLSGVARSYNFYPIGDARPEEGIVSLALGLGKTIVDGGISWSYSPQYPTVNPPFNSINDLLDQTQKEFWCVNMGKPPAYDPIKETEYLIQANLMDAEYDNTLKYIASTYDNQSDRINPGINSKGPRIINFAPLLELDQFNLNGIVKTIMQTCETYFGNPVEIEFAVTFPSLTSESAYFGMLQVRPIHVSHETVVIESDESGSRCLVTSTNVLGNGTLSSIHDVVYLKPEKFDFKYSRIIAQDLEKINRLLIDNNQPYLLVVFGRLGSSDSWLGIPVEWGQISGAKTIVEAKLSHIHVDLSQGSHFFHNISNLKIFYFSPNLDETKSFDWNWLNAQKIVLETDFVKHVHLTSPLLVKVDGRKKTGVILK
jgi:hypothetical protein